MAKRGPKPTARPILQLRGSWRGNQGGTVLQGDQKRPARPYWLVGAGRKEWDRVAPKLFAEGLLSELDRVPLALYCQAYADYLDAIGLVKSPLIKTTNGNIIQNPAVAVANQAWKRCLPWKRHSAMALSLSVSHPSVARWAIPSTVRRSPRSFKMSQGLITSIWPLFSIRTDRLGWNPCSYAA